MPHHRNSMTDSPDPPAKPGRAVSIAAASAAVARSLGNGAKVALPERVSARIDQHEDDAEVVVRLFQLAIVILFGSLYFVSPKTDAATSFALAPYAIGFYFTATMIGLVWSLRQRLPEWAVFGSIMIDLGMLFTMIWSFHLQYEQPASFYLKAPTLLYVFIFIALRALRFRARFVIVTGLLAAAGWVVLVLFAIMRNPSDNMITKDYVAYLTGNHVLVGAEIDKIVSILTVTAILAIVLTRARRILVQAVTEGIAARDLSRFFDESVADRIRSSEHEVAAGQGVTRRAAVFNVDIRGFSVLASTLGPNVAMHLLSEYQHRLVPLIQASGGTIDKFMGDGIMATFGATVESPTYAADALRALDAVIAEAERFAADQRAKGETVLNINASVASGDIIFGAVGDSSRLEYTVIGTPVNLAAKLEKHNKVLASRAVVSAEALETAVAQGYEPPGQVERISEQIDGIEGPAELAILYR